jgi:osmoprotectant transport system permease protein
LGSSVVFNALATGEIDVYVDYSGTLWANQLKRADVKPPAEVLAEVTKELEAQYGIKVLGSLGFENAYALAMPQKRADALGVRAIGDLTSRASELSIAGDYEFFGRPEWAALRDAYGLAFKAQRQMQPEFMYPAVAAGDVDVISAYTSDGRMAQYQLTVLDDPKRAIPPYEAILLISPRRANDPVFIGALQPLVGAIDVSVMREANLRSASGAADAAPDTVARWLWDEVQRRKAATR